MKQPVLDTTDFFSIDSGDEIRIGEKKYRITGHEKERRFGIEDPKFWVKRAVDLDSGERKIIKLAYFETFETLLGGVKIRCFRDPDKEGRILDLTRGHPQFMQGQVFKDVKDNNIRVLDIVSGPNFMVAMDRYLMDHQEYFFHRLPEIFKRLIPAFGGILMLHRAGFRHGDIRNDHLIIESGTGDYVWIDFDYDYHAPENPFSLDLIGMGHILAYAVGKGFHELYMIMHDTETYGSLIGDLTAGDFSILDKSRFMNLQKLYPYIPPSLNNILMHFSSASEIYYEQVEELMEDLSGVVIR